jgi:hypothetical protein
VLAVGRHVLEIAYSPMAQPTAYRELGTDYFDRYSAERLKRRSLDQLRRLAYQVTLTQLTQPPNQDFSGQTRIDNSNKSGRGDVFVTRPRPD